jgi:hypothetical protein
MTSHIRVWIITTWAFFLLRFYRERFPPTLITLAGQGVPLSTWYRNA